MIRHHVPLLAGKVDLQITVLFRHMTRPSRFSMGNSEGQILWPRLIGLKREHRTKSPVYLHTNSSIEPFVLHILRGFVRSCTCSNLRNVNGGVRVRGSQNINSRSNVVFTVYNYHIYEWGMTVIDSKGRRVYE
jgi:hypothetical protein